MKGTKGKREREGDGKREREGDGKREQKRREPNVKGQKKHITESGGSRSSLQLAPHWLSKLSQSWFFLL